MTNDVLEEWHRLAERIARVPQYDFGKFEPQWGSPLSLGKNRKRECAVSQPTQQMANPCKEISQI